MARTRKSIQPLNLYKYDVLIEDRGSRSDYFKVSQFDGYFYGGRNAFLVAGAGVLQPNSKILVEVLNTDGNVVYSAPVTDFVEGNSRLVQVEVYSDTAIGPGKLVLLGCATSYLDGTPIPEEWKDKYNVRWVSDVTISPLVQNKTPIRFVKNPSVTVEEKFYTSPSSSTFTERVTVPVDVQLTPKYYNVSQVGYQIRLDGPGNTQFSSDYVNGAITGSIFLTYGSTLETASINLPLTKIYNTRLADSQGSLIRTNKNTVLSKIFLSSSGLYTQEVVPFGEVTITGSVDLQYSKLETFNTASSISYAKLRAVDTRTLSGEINKVRVFYKVSNEPGDFVALADVNVGVQELLAVDSSSQVALTGKFNEVVVNDYWYFATMSLTRNETSPTIPLYYLSSSLVGNKISEDACCNDLLDAINTTPPIVGGTFVDDKAYFIGTRTENSLKLFPGSEYTLKFDALASKISASISLEQSDYSLEVYLVEQENSTTTLLEKSKRGQLLGTLTPAGGFGKQNFENTQFNFIPRINLSGLFGLRFVVYGGNWTIANVSVKPAEEAFFSPDEIEFLVPNINYGNKLLTYKLQYVDINNNSTGIETLSIPTYFTGSETIPIILIESSSYATTASYLDYQNPGNNRIITSVTSGSLTGEPNLQFDGSTLNVTGSLVVSGSSTLRNIGPAQFTGSVNISGSTTITGSLSVSGLLSATSQSVQYVTSSQLNIGTNLITVNTQNPAPRFGGLAVIDSGSSPQRSGSLLFDSLNDQWIFVHQNQTNPTSSVVLMGPQTYNNIGNETNLTNNYLLKSVNAEHVGDSQIYDNGTNVGIGTNSPNTKLHIYTASVAADTNFIKVQMPSWSTSTNYLKNIIWSDGSDVGAIGMKYDGSKVNMHFHSFYNGGYTTSASVMMVINGNGNVGIGTTNPGSLLHVQGAVSASSYTANGNTVWHAGNDGAGSGLDADLLDGENSTVFLKQLSGGTEASIDTYTDNGFRTVSYTGHSRHLLSWNAGGSTGTVQQEFHYGTAANGWRIRNKTDNTTWSSWGYVVMTSTNQGLLTGTVWTSGNDGAGSGLDADLLDGNHASAFYLASNPSGYTTNTGTVTSVGGTGTVSGLTLTGTVTTTGNLTLGGTLSVAASNFSSQTANYFLAAPNGSAGTPTFRAIVAADIPTLNQNTTGTAFNITQYTINQNLGTSSGPSFAALTVGPGNASDAYIEVGSGRSASGYAYVDLTGDTTYTDYGLRMIRGNGGANTTSDIIHRGTGLFRLTTNEAAALTFNTTNTERVRIDSSGNVGIGTTNPSTLLHLSSSTAQITLDSSNDAASWTSGIILKTKFYRGSGIRYDNKDGNEKWYAGVPYASNYLGYQIGYDGSSAGAPEYLASASLYINSSRNVGIGTTSPQTKLNVFVGAGGSDGTAGIRVGSTNNYESLELGIIGSYGAMIRSYGNDIHYYAGHWKTIGATATEDHRHYWYTSKASSTNWSTVKMALDESGNLGIGISAPFADTNYKSVDIRGVTGGQVNLGTTLGREAQLTADNTNGLTLNTINNTPIRFFLQGGEEARLTKTGLGIGTSSPGYKLDIIGRLRFRSNGSNSAGVWHTDNSGTENVFVGLGGISSTDAWGVYSNSNWRFQLTNTDGHVLLNGKTAFESTDSWLRINQSAAFSSGVWFGSTPNIALGGTDSYMSLGSNGGTTTSRIYFRVGTYNGTNVMNFDGTSGNAYFAGNIGIGVSPTSNRLDIQGGHTTTTARLYSIGDGASSDASLDMWASEPGVTYSGAGIGNNVNGHPYYGRRNTGLGQSYIRFYGGNIYFYASGSTATNANITIDTSGNLGIGNASPSYKLDIAGAGSGVGAVRLTPDHGKVRFHGYDLLGYNGGNLWLISNTSTNQLTLGTSWDWDTSCDLYYQPGTTGAAAGVLIIGQTNKNSATWTHGITELRTNGTTRMYINSAGRVGIGTTSPSRTLHVVGDILGEGTNGYGLNASSGRYYFFDNFTGNNYIGLSAANSVALAAGGSVTLTVTSGLLEVTGNIKATGNLSVDGTLGFRRGSGDYGTYIKANGYPGQGYANSDGTKYWVELGAAGGVHIVLNTDGGAGSVENAYDHFTVWQGSNSGDRLFYVTNTGNAYIKGTLGIGTTSPNGILDVVSSTNLARIFYVKGPSYGVRIGADGSGGYLEGVDASNGVTSYQPLYVGGSTVYIQSSGTTKVTVNVSGSQITSLGVGTSPSNTTGEIRATNEITAYYSDARLKNFHGTIQESLVKINKLNGYYFTENEVAKSLGYKNDKMQIGLSAQEVQAVLPEAVVPAPIDDMYLTVKYEKLVPLLIEAIKEQQILIDQLQERVDNLTHMM
jgi:hypothetical protein